ncbi:hypothetical protein FRX31_013618, partial [Thalictrum thalictroides]
AIICVVLDTARFGILPMYGESEEAGKQDTLFLPSNRRAFAQGVWDSQGNYFTDKDDSWICVTRLVEQRRRTGTVKNRITVVEDQ